MKILSLNVNGYYKKNGIDCNNEKEDKYAKNINKMFDYLKLQVNNSRDIIICLQEFRIYKESDMQEEDIKKLFELGKYVTFDNKCFTEEKFDDLKSYLVEKKIKYPKNYYFTNVMICNYLKEMKLKKRKFDSPDNLEFDMVRNRIVRYVFDMGNGRFLYLINVHLVSSNNYNDSDETKNFKNGCIEALKSDIQYMVKNKRCFLVVGDFNYENKLEEDSGDVNPNRSILLMLKDLDCIDIYKENRELKIIEPTCYKSEESDGKRFDNTFIHRKVNDYFSNFNSIIDNSTFYSAGGFTDHAAIIITFEVH